MKVTCHDFSTNVHEKWSESLALELTSREIWELLVACCTQLRVPRVASFFISGQHDAFEITVDNAHVNLKVSEDAKDFCGHCCLERLDIEVRIQGI